MNLACFYVSAKSYVKWAMERISHAHVAWLQPEARFFPNNNELPVHTHSSAIVLAERCW